MKKNWQVFIFLILTFSVSATEQESDILIIENDTIYFQSFPLESLNFIKRPFTDSVIQFVSSSCWRGYKAVWKICDNKLYLERIIRCYGDTREGEQNIKDLFFENGINYQEKNGMILADWVSSNYYESNSLNADLSKSRIYLYDILSEIWYYDDKVLRLKIEQGEIILNRLKS